jgi:hypothetical protein
MKLNKIILILIVIPFYLSGWNSTGHKIVAALVFEKAAPEMQTEMEDILRNHPEYGTWIEEKPEGLEEGSFLMMRASSWADEIKKTESMYNHPEWHYVNFFICRETGISDTTRESPSNGIIYAIEKSLNLIKTGSEVEKAVYLSWLIHLVADIHQPMHCASVKSEEFPEGDRGGNKYWVRNGFDPIKLHSYWDKLPGNISGYENIKASGNRLIKLFPEAEFQAADSAQNVYDWAEESLNILYENVHLKFDLPVSNNPSDAVPLSEEYHTMAQRIYEHRITAAAYRLLNLLNSILQ